MWSARLLATAPWSRAVTLLRHRPAVALAVAGASVVLGTAASSAPLFLSSSGNAALHRQLDTGCAASAAPTVAASAPFSTGFFHGAQSKDAQVRSTFAGVPRLGAPVTTVFDTASLGDYIHLVPAGGASTGGQPTSVRLLNRDDYAGHISVVRDAGGSGVWLPEDVAKAIGSTPGQPLGLQLDQYAASTRVRGTYVDLRTQPADAYWCSIGTLFHPVDPWSNAPVLPVVLMDRPAFESAATALHVRAVATWEFPLPTGRLTTSAAGPVVDGIERALPSLVADGFRFDQRLGHDLRRAELVQGSLRSTLDPVAIAGIFVALVVVAAAGAYWVDRRRTEVTLLVARGVGPAMLAVKASLEMLPATVLGTIGGSFLARWIVRAVGPSHLLSAHSLDESLLWAAGAAAGATVLVGLVAGLRSRTIESRPVGKTSSRLSRAPWELVPLAAVGVVVWFFTSGGVRAGVDTGTGVGTVARVDPRLLALPLLALVGCVCVVVRLLTPALRRLETGGDRLRPSMYLTARRIGGARAASLVMIGAAALPIGVSAYAATMTQSVQTTLDAKVLQFTGADVIAQLPGREAVPASLRAHSTLVQHLPGQFDHNDVDVLGIDPATYFQGVFAGVSGDVLRPLVAQLGRASVGGADGSGAGGAIPAIVVGAPSSATASTLSVISPDGVKQVAVHVIGTPDQVPGQRNQAVVLVPAADLAKVTPNGCCELWVRGDEQDILSTLTAAHLQVSTVSRASQVVDASSFLPVTYTFQFLTALAVLTGVVGLVGLLLHVESRTRARRVAFVLTKSMGLRAGAAFTAYLAEFAVLLGVGGLIGVALAEAASAAAYGHLDVAPDLVPGPLLSTPARALGVLGAATVVVIVGVAAYAQWTSHRIRPAEVLRDTAG